MILLKIIVAGAAMFCIVVAVMYFAQRSLMYLPERQRTSPAEAGLPDVQEIVLDTTDGKKVVAWFSPPKQDMPLVLYFHGNAGALRHRAGRFRALIEAGYGLVALSYRGYGGSSGTPTEAGLIADALAAHAFAASHIAPELIAVFGESLGTGVAVALAATQKVGCVVLESPFASAVEIGANVYWYLPVRLLMKDTYRSDRRIGQVKVPLLVLHGERDRVVPIASGERLFSLANEPKRFKRFAEAGHNDLDQHGALEALLRFLRPAPL
jgi:fermentation-respiration switch protein FrsA (DUF1100 family)